MYVRVYLVLCSVLLDACDAYARTCTRFTSTRLRNRPASLHQYCYRGCSVTRFAQRDLAACWFAKKCEIRIYRDTLYNFFKIEAANARCKYFLQGVTQTRYSIVNPLQLYAATIIKIKRVICEIIIRKNVLHDRLLIIPVSIVYSKKSKTCDKRSHSPYIFAGKKVDIESRPEKNGFRNSEKRIHLPIK